MRVAFGQKLFAKHDKDSQSAYVLLAQNAFECFAGVGVAFEHVLGLLNCPAYFPFLWTSHIEPFGGAAVYQEHLHCQR